MTVMVDIRPVHKSFGCELLTVLDNVELAGEVLDVVRDLAAQGTTVIVVTHEIAFAREVADTVVFMADGRIVEQGSPGEVLGAPREERTRAFLAKVL
ncbi:hypothetical protein M878_35690 [Streptomyces roseochromogenus subsp. oscitans DS 12.976]|uniref:Amino acid ABC transporter ATP-binding protein n=1 Tax=Streptomyces roseochromogenus subsp. oscitans DS 12.976 TaxID=1352936 RepID=V6JPX0_STRRC|nr:hypothetical protein M878_35690 [Streptomyces roseochromogenus subsp. oscitans DS 12.976]